MVYSLTHLLGHSKQHFASEAAVCVCVPQCWSQDRVADDEVKLLQVGSWPVLQHAVAVVTVLTIVKALGDLKCITL